MELSNAALLCFFIGSIFLTEKSFGKNANKNIMKSVYSDLSISSCEKIADKNDPNETPYYICPGVAGYTLASRTVDSGRESIGVINPAKQESPLNFERVITNQMAELGKRAEWRINQKIPVALIIPVRVHGDPELPEKVTQTYLAIAKITLQETCVTSRILKGSLSQSKIYALADSAPQKKCLAPSF